MLEKIRMQKPRTLIIFAIILVVVIGASAMAATLFIQYQASIAPPDKNETIAGTQKSPTEQKADAAEKLVDEGDLNAGVQSLDDAIKNTTDLHEKFTYYSHKATILLNNQDLPGALTAALQAYEIEKTSAIAALVGQIAREKGDKPQAIEYYKKAIQLINTEDPFANEDKSYYEGIITELEGGTPRE